MRTIARLLLIGETKTLILVFGALLLVLEAQGISGTKSIAISNSEIRISAKTARYSNLGEITLARERNANETRNSNPHQIPVNDSHVIILAK
jgi:hypothetical protein